MTSIKVKFRASTVIDKEGSLVFQIIHMRKVKLITTSFKVFRSEWSFSLEKVIIPPLGEPRYAYLLKVSRQLELEHCKLQAVVSRLESADKPFAVQKIGNGYAGRARRIYFLSFMDERILYLESKQKNQTANGYRYTQRAFSRFLTGKDILLEYLTSAVLLDFQEYILSGGASLNTVSFYMRILRASYNQAILRIGLEQPSPFKKVFTGICRTTKRAVDESIMSALKALDLSGKPMLGFSRDLFLFSFYTRGMSYVDIIKLKKKNIHEGFLHYVRSKTNQPMIIKIEPCMDEIIRKYIYCDTEYVFPVISKSGNAFTTQHTSGLRIHNKRLKIISDLLQLQLPITSYVARHTWATIARHRGVPLGIISESMGHQSENTTRIYLASFNQQVLDQVNKMVIAGKRNK